MSKIKVNQIEAATGSTITIPSGQTLDLSSGTVNLPSSALSALNASNLTSGTVPSARLSLTSSDLPTVPTTKGGTGLTTIGTAGQVLKVNSGATALEFGTAPSGKVLQVIQVTKTDTQSFAGDGVNSPENFFDITGLSTSITPASASNKILILANVMGSGTNNSFLSVFRGSTNLASPTSPSGRTPTFAGDFNNYVNNDQSLTFSIIYLDSPSTTSSTTYKLGVTIWGSGTDIYINRAETDSDAGWQPRGVSSLILMEIGA